jgi:hypothetical protein
MKLYFGQEATLPAKTRLPPSHLKCHFLHEVVLTRNNTSLNWATVSFSTFNFSHGCNYVTAPLNSLSNDILMTTKSYVCQKMSISWLLCGRNKDFHYWGTSDREGLHLSEHRYIVFSSHHNWIIKEKEDHVLIKEDDKRKKKHVKIKKMRQSLMSQDVY